LKWAGLGLRQIARSCSIGLATVHDYLQRAAAAGVTWPLGEDWDEDRLETALFGGPPRARPATLPIPDFAELHQQRQVHPQLTQQLLWEDRRLIFYRISLAPSRTFMTTDESRSLATAI